MKSVVSLFLAEVDEIAHHFRVGTGRNLRYLKKRAFELHSLAQKQYHRKPKADYALLNAFMREQSEKVNGIFTQRSMVQWIKDKFGFGSFWMMNKVFQQFKWTKVTYF